MDNWQVALTVILAILTGVLIPAIVQLQRTLRTIQKFVETNSEPVESFLASLDDVGKSVRQIRTAVRAASVVAAAVGPAIATAIRANREHATNGATNGEEIRR
jgi:hypothetical protein